MGNGADLPISHIGSSFVSEPSSSTLFTLSKLLHALKITTILITVNQFAKDNHVFLNFTQMFALRRTKQREASYSKGGYMKDCTISICPSSTPSSSVQSSQPTSVLSKKSVQSRCPLVLSVESNVSEYSCSNSMSSFKSQPKFNVSGLRSFAQEAWSSNFFSG